MKFLAILAALVGLALIPAAEAGERPEVCVEQGTPSGHVHGFVRACALPPGLDGVVCTDVDGASWTPNLKRCWIGF